MNKVEKELEDIIREVKLKEYNVDKSLLDSLTTEISLKSINISEGDEKESDASISFGVGYFTGFLIYIFMFAYGGQVMQGVIEEKNSKIVEVIVSTVKPFQLMMGKILGVASVGLLQFLIWILLVTTLSTAVLFLFGVQMPQAEAMEMAQNLETAEGVSEGMQWEEFRRLIETIPFTKIILCFIFYFLGGYLLYGALFAAVRVSGRYSFGCATIYVSHHDPPHRRYCRHGYDP